MILPAAALQQHIAILGKTGSGKTFAAKGIVEGLLAGGACVGIVDPTSAWWGLRHDGKGAGFKVLVLGGDHGDIGLAPTSGAAVARLLVEQRVSLVADTGLMSVGERTRWFIDFATAVYRLNRTPLHLVLDEAHNFAPQGKVHDPDAGKMLHAANSLASGGRSRGIRLTMITQRPQKLHKDTLTSADTLVAMRVLAPHDRDAVHEWIDGCGDRAQGKAVLDSLASLQRGEGWVWYPEGHHLERVRFPAIRTFDSSATPTGGQAAPAPKHGADIDLTEIKASLANAMKEAEANDPKALRARIAELERAIAKAAPTTDSVLIEQERRSARADGYREAVRALLPMADRLLAMRAQIDAAIHDLESWRVMDDTYRQSQAPTAPSPASAPRAQPRQQNAGHVQREPSPPAPAGSLGNTGKRRMLIALAQNPKGLTGRKLSILTGISQSGGTWRTYLAELRTNGWVEGSRDELRITVAGRAVLGAYEPLPTGDALQEYWRARLGNSGKTKILDTLISYYPESVPAEAVAAETSIAIAGGTWRTYLAELRGLELIEGSRDALRAADALFD